MLAGFNGFRTSAAAMRLPAANLRGMAPALALFLSIGMQILPLEGGTPPASPQVVASLERGVCFGTCPEYKVVVFSDGTATYEGLRFVKVKGRHSAKLTAEELAGVESVFEKGCYFTLHDRYMQKDETDQPMVTTSYRHDGRTKSIEHYHGDESAPQSLSELEDALDQALHTERWIGTEAERNELQRQHGLDW